MLKDIRDSLARPPRPNNNRDDNRPDDDDDNRPDNDDDNRPDNDNDDNDDNDDNRPDNDDNLNKKLNNIQKSSENYARLIAHQNIIIEKLKKELTDKKN